MLMNQDQFSRLRLRFTGAVSMGIWAVLIWKQTHGGVPTHHLLHRADLPGLSCWWDALVLPVLTWMLLARIRPRLVVEVAGSGSPAASPSALQGFFGAIGVGILFSALFVAGQETALSYALNGLLVAALFFPIYRAECVLGFVLGMTFTFGSVLPLIFGSLVACVGLLLHRFIRPLLARFGSWMYGR
jgi:hypothetical protein